MAKKATENSVEVGDIVSIRGQVIGIDETGAVTIEVSCDERKNKHNVTFTGDQAAHAVSFVEKGEMPEPDAPFSMDDVFAKGQAEGYEVKLVEEADKVGTKDGGGAA